jgi:hypothetical protein
VVVRRAVREADRLGSANLLQENVAVDDEGNVRFVLGVDGKLAGVAGKGDGALGVGLVVGVDLNGQLARQVTAARAGDPEVGPALVDNPFAVAAEAGTADPALLGSVPGEDLGLDQLGRLAGRDAGDDRCWLADDVGRGTWSPFGAKVPSLPSATVMRVAAPPSTGTVYSS